MKRGIWEEYDHTDQEMSVYEHSCINCRNTHCPMMMPETATEHYAAYGTLSDFDEDEAEKGKEEVMKRRSEDAAMYEGELRWCIYWKGNGERNEYK